jgi:integrase
MPRTRIAVPLLQWPERDQALWQAAQQGGDFFDDGGIAAAWQPVTRANVITAYGRWLAFLTSRDALDPQLPPAERVTRLAVQAYISHLRAGGAVSSAASQIGTLVLAMRALAPNRDWRWLQNEARRLKHLSRPVRDKRGRLQPTVDLMAFGIALMRQVDRDGAVSGWEQAVTFRDGLMIALHAVRPVRRRSFIGIRIGEHLEHRADGYWMVFAEGDTKTKQPLEFPFPAELLPYLERYLVHYRPWLCAQDSHRDPRFSFRPPGQRLWVSKTGSAYSPEAYYSMVRERTAARFGAALWPHLFRDCAASSVANERPRNIGIIKSVLGHARLKTSERHYIHAQSVAAVRRFQDHILELRACAKATQRRTRVATTKLEN